MPIWVAFCEQSMVSSWSRAAWAKHVSRIRVCSSTSGSDQPHSDAVLTSCRAGEGASVSAATCPAPSPEEALGGAPTWARTGDPTPGC